jgi:folate-binding protein YgfZ
VPDDSSSAASGTWHAPREDLAAVLREPVLASLDELGVIAARGEDATTFLQSQLTADIAAIDAARVQPAGYCTAKGRLLATFHVWRGEGEGDGSALFLLMPRELLAPVLKRLSMFVLRTKVKLTDASGEWSAFALMGPGAAELIADSVGGEPPVVGVSLAQGGAHLVRLVDAPRVTERFLVLVPRSDVATWNQRLQKARAVHAGVWWWTQIDAGIPEVFAATQEKFVPQMINFEVLGGVSFKKGCYPGQEVVARSQYLGKLRRRMAIAHCAAETQAGADVFSDGEAQPIGTVVMAAAAPEGGMDLLFERPVDRPWAAPHAGVPDGPALTLRPLPYALFDPTA